MSAPLSDLPNVGYVSNVSAGLLNNNILIFDSPKKLICRSYFKVQQKGAFNYRFWFSNNVFSTFEEGARAYPNREGGMYSISSAWVGYSAAASPDCPPDGVQALLFGGNRVKKVSPGEEFFSDVLPLSPDDRYLVFEYSLEGSELPMTEDSQIPCFTDYGGGFSFDVACPKPNLIACDRPVKARVAFIGDSITQGCATENDKYEFWAARIAAGLGDGYSCANFGLGYARARDFAGGGRWLNAASNADVAIVCLGVNDLLHEKGVGKGGSDASEVAARIDASVAALVSRGVRVILFNVPPFNFYEVDSEPQWREVNSLIPSIAKRHGADWFDMAAVLSEAPPNDAMAKYGPHPNGEGGKAVASAFLSREAGYGEYGGYGGYAGLCPDPQAFEKA